MARKAGVPGLAVGLATAGGLLVYAGLRGVTPLQALKDILQSGKTGTAPPGLPAGQSVTIGGDFGPGGSTGGGDFSSGGTALGQRIASDAQRYLGVKYRWGGSSPSTGFDCSGLVWYVMNHDLGLAFPRTSSMQLTSSKVRKISRSEVGAGDFVGHFGVPGHIGIALNNRNAIFAPHTGTVVQIQNIDSVIPRALGIYVRYIGPSSNVQKLLETAPASVR
jgi:cell wall-associated NlpC family hydrolase